MLLRSLEYLHTQWKSYAALVPNIRYSFSKVGRWFQSWERETDAIQVGWSWRCYCWANMQRVPKDIMIIVMTVSVSSASFRWMSLIKWTILQQRCDHGFSLDEFALKESYIYTKILQQRDKWVEGRICQTEAQALPANFNIAFVPVTQDKSI